MPLGMQSPALNSDYIDMHCSHHGCFSTHQPNPSALTTVQHILRYSPKSNRKRRFTQSALLWVMRTCDPEEFRQLVSGTVERRFRIMPTKSSDLVSLPSPLMIYVTKIFRSDEKSYHGMLNVLAEERLHDLDLQSKFSIIKSLQITRASSDLGFQSTFSEAEAKVVFQIFQSVEGIELQSLKDMLNEGGNRLNLHHLVFSSLTQHWRYQILQYFELQGAECAKEKQKPVKVLSDIDDTIFSSLLDKRYPGNVVYPGVRQFFAELTRNNSIPTAETRHKTSFKPEPGSNSGEVDKPSTLEVLEKLDERATKMISSMEANRTNGKYRAGRSVEIPHANILSSPTSKPETQSHIAKWRQMWIYIEDRAETLFASRQRLTDKNSGTYEDKTLEFMDEFDDNVSEDTDVQITESELSTSINTDCDEEVVMDQRSYSQRTADRDINLSDVTYLTARPKGVRGVFAAITRRKLRKAGVSGKPNVMSGDMPGLLGSKRMAEKKFENFREFAQLFPEYNYILVGDSGQGDAALGARMSERFPESFSGAFIHDISPEKETTGDGMHKLDYMKTYGFNFFRSYVGCALHAYKSGLIRDPDSLLRVCLAAESELLDVPFKNSKKFERMKISRWRDLQADIRKALVVLKE